MARYRTRICRTWLGVLAMETEDRWRWTNDIMAFVVVISVILMIFLEYDIPQFMVAGYLGALTWTWGMKRLFDYYKKKSQTG